VNLKKGKQLSEVNLFIFTILKEGEQGESLFIIKEGTVSCRKGEHEVRQLSNRDYFGESAILFGTKRTLSIVALSKTTCFQISHSLMVENLGENYKNIVLKSIAKEAFQKSRYMKLLVFDNYFNKIFSLFQLQYYQNEDIVMSKSENTKRIIVVLEGNLQYRNNLNEIAATRGELFGEQFVKKLKER
jgi:cGMP-dependent protein kinase